MELMSDGNGMVAPAPTPAEAADHLPSPARGRNPSRPPPPLAGRRWTGLVAAGFGWLRSSLPTLLVLAALVGAFFWGHHTGWKAPKFSDLWDQEDPEKEDWCSKHNVPGSQCVVCNPELLGQGARGWCKTHGPGGSCPACRGESGGGEEARDWCRTHGLPESQCPLCHPEIAQVEGPARPPETDPLPALALVKRKENNPACTHHLRVLQFASPAAVEAAGVTVATVQERPMAEFIPASGEIIYDQTRVARLTTRVPGTVWRVLKRVGEKVDRGEVLALVDAAEVGRAKTEVLQALVQFQLKRKNVVRLSGLIASGAVPERQVREAETALSEARIRLLSAQQALVNLGLPELGLPSRREDGKEGEEEEIARKVHLLGLPGTAFDPQTTPATLIPVRAPLDGLVTSCEVVAGEVVDPTKTLFVVADVRLMGLALDLRLEDVRNVAVGRAVWFQPDGSPEQATGKVSWISTAVDEKTRTVKVRAELANPQGLLRARTFGPARIILREEAKVVAVPSEAVHWEGCCHVVFVRDKDIPNVFHPRKVRPGTRDGQFTEILAGVLPGEAVAAAGSAVLRAALLKHKIGG